jgi:hypothetical protein
MASQHTCFPVSLSTLYSALNQKDAFFCQGMTLQDMILATCFDLHLSQGIPGLVRGQSFSTLRTLSSIVRICAKKNWSCDWVVLRGRGWKNGVGAGRGWKNGVGAGRGWKNGVGAGSTRGDFLAPVDGCHCITHYPLLV